MRIDFRPIDDLTPYAKNSRTHSAEQVRQLAAAIREWGWTMPVLVDEFGGVIAGHGRILAAALAYEEGAALRMASGDVIPAGCVPVMVAAGWSAEQVRAYVIADNKLALNAGWDKAMLKAELDALDDAGFDLALVGFDADELLALDDPDEVDVADEEEGESKGINQKFVKIDGDGVPATDEEIDALKDAVNAYISENGMPHGFFAMLLRRAGVGNA